MENQVKVLLEDNNYYLTEYQLDRLIDDLISVRFYKRKESLIKCIVQKYLEIDSTYIMYNLSNKLSQIIDVYSLEYLYSKKNSNEYYIGVL